jgi:hypothetical protein
VQFEIVSKVVKSVASHGEKQPLQTRRNRKTPAQHRAVRAQGVVESCNERSIQVLHDFFFVQLSIP